MKRRGIFVVDFDVVVIVALMYYAGRYSNFTNGELAYTSIFLIILKILADTLVDSINEKHRRR